MSDWSWKPQPQDMPVKRYVPKAKVEAKPKRKFRKRRFRVRKDIAPEGAKAHIKSILQE